jgi:hypothetical protein
MRLTSKVLLFKNLSGLLLAGWLCCCFVTADAPALKSIDAQVKSILAAKKSGQLTVKVLEHMSPSGGALTGYYQGQKLVLIEQQFNAEYGFHALDLYFAHDSLIYVIEEVIELQYFAENDAAYQAYVKKHTNSEGDLDMSNWPKAVEEENHYYFHKDQIISASGKNKGRKSKFTPELLAEKQSAIRLHALTYRQELSR